MVSNQFFTYVFAPIFIFICGNHFVTLPVKLNLVMVENLVAILVNTKIGGDNKNVKNVELSRDDKMYSVSGIWGAQLPQNVFLFFWQKI